MAQNLPLIDVSKLNEPEVYTAFIRAFEDIGAARFTGYDPALEQAIGAVYGVADDLFSLPPDEKAKLVRPEAHNDVGYTPPKGEKSSYSNKPDPKEYWHTRRDWRSAGPSPADWHETPSVSAAFDHATRGAFREFEKLALDLSEIFSRYMDKPRDHLRKQMDRAPYSALRLLNYRSEDYAEKHRDRSFITLLAPRQPGLRIETRAGEWIPAQAGENEIIGNTGRLAGILTRDRILPCNHDVVTAEPRRSVVFFGSMNADAVISPDPKFGNAPLPDEYPQKPMTVRDYVESRVKANDYNGANPDAVVEKFRPAPGR
ncbi:MAG TPA: 2-oxoglutarate and iron-dependent oxygenase domain-containing protein [Micavibrio sp.]|jgi:isopenicillin N synthase-like dioxygenase